MDQQIWTVVLEYLALKEQEGKAAETELLWQRLKEWVGSDIERQAELDQAISLWRDMASMEETSEWKIGFDQISHQLNPLTETRKKMKLWPAWSAVAAASIGVTLFFFFKNDNPNLKTEATWITKIAATGKVLDVVLPDSSEIWLNSGSSISYPENIQHTDTRTVKLTGEAFFKVKRDPQHPFIVKSLNIQTRVLGTSFNIRAWKGFSPEVTVLTGKVAVSRDSAGGQSTPIHLVPNQKGIYDIKKAALLKEEIPEAALSTGWKEGKMFFERTPMSEVFETISRKYGMAIRHDGSFDNCELTAKFDNVDIKSVLRTLELTFGIHYTINKQIIDIKGGKCN